ncbi:THAP domain-containing protein 3 [Trichomycterus rosablanca]|uniref:THAP domain-containing protein 3 n=1 Tax=Trichomycterus rosablanca TaxID=2290929 RepID=UPI002F35522F
MPKSCSAYKCTSRYSSKNPEITFHRFPLSKPSVLKQWLHNIGRENFQPRKHMVICSLHFTPDCFSGAGNRKNLLWNSVPTLFSIPPQDAMVSAGREQRSLKTKEPAPHSWDSFAPEYSFSIPNQTEKVQEHCIQTSSKTPDHSYALLDPCSAKTRLFEAFEMNSRLQKRFKTKCKELKKIKQSLQAAERKLMAIRCWHDFRLTQRQKYLWPPVKNAQRKTCFISQHQLRVNV